MLGFLMPPNALTYFEIQEYYQNESKFNRAYSRNNLPKSKDGSYVIIQVSCRSVGTHRIALYAKMIMQHIFIALELNIFQKKLKIS